MLEPESQPRRCCGEARGSALSDDSYGEGSQGFTEKLVAAVYLLTYVATALWLRWGHRWQPDSEDKDCGRCASQSVGLAMVISLAPLLCFCGAYSCKCGGDRGRCKAWLQGGQRHQGGRAAWAATPGLLRGDQGPATSKTKRGASQNRFPARKQ